MIDVSVFDASIIQVPCFDDHPAIEVFVTDLVGPFNLVECSENGWHVRLSKIPELTEHSIIACGHGGIVAAAEEYSA
jgi:hypothetical protein